MKTISPRTLILSLAVCILISCAAKGPEIGVLGIYLEMPQADFLKLNEKKSLGFVQSSALILPSTIQYTSTNFSWLQETFEVNVAILEDRVQYLALLSDRHTTAGAAVTLYTNIEKELKSTYGAPDREIGEGNNPGFLIEQIEKGEKMYAYCKWDETGLQHSILGNKDGDDGISVSTVFMTAESTRFLRHYD